MTNGTITPSPLLVVGLDRKVRGEAMEWEPIKDGSVILLPGKKAIADGWLGGLTGAEWVWPYIYAEPFRLPRRETYVAYISNT